MGYFKEREQIKKIGNFPKAWGAKVDKMSDPQVLAIYMKLKSQGKL